MSDIDIQIQEHIVDINNPHGVTKADVGLGSVLNYTLATVAEAQAGTITNRYLTPYLLKEVFKGVLIREGYLDTDGTLLV